MVTAILSGCAHTVINTRTDVFQEVSPEGKISQGYAELNISSSLKTHKAGKYPLDEMIGNKKGTSDYALLINIDGQVANIKGILKEENIESHFSYNPESGEGIRYIFSDNFQIKAGRHRLVVAIPEDCINIEKEVTLSEGMVNVIKLVPVYNDKSIERTRSELLSDCYPKQIKRFDLLLNGKLL